jgi:hypothetical protein
MGGGSQNPNNRARGLQSDREKLKRTKEGRTDIHDFEQALYKAQIALLILLRDQQRGGIDMGCP